MESGVAAAVNLLSRDVCRLLMVVLELFWLSALISRLATVGDNEVSDTSIFRETQNPFIL